jgi:type II secretory pathway pseudopilin PulG
VTSADRRSVEEPNGCSAEPRAVRDHGTTLIELLISIVLLGIGVVGMLQNLTVTISASATERDHANAHAWLQSASDVLYGIERVDCGTTTATNPNVASVYQDAVKGTSDPENWGSDKINVLPPVLFWDGEIYQDVCYDDLNINLQLITIEVRNPANDIVEVVQVVKG